MRIRESGVSSCTRAGVGTISFRDEVLAEIVGSGRSGSKRKVEALASNPSDDPIPSPPFARR